MPSAEDHESAPGKRPRATKVSLPPSAAYFKEDDGIVPVQYAFAFSIV